jgi:hypothetical protein
MVETRVTGGAHVTTYGPHKAIADAFDAVAEALHDAADVIRDERPPEHDDDDRTRAAARDRMRRLRARRRDANTRNSDANSDACSRNEFDENPRAEGARYADRPNGRSVGRNEGGPSERVTSDANSDANTRNARDDNPGNPWAVDPLDDDERERAQAKIREMSEQLREQRKGET